MFPARQRIKAIVVSLVVALPGCASLDKAINDHHGGSGSPKSSASRSSSSGGLFGSFGAGEDKARRGRVVSGPRLYQVQIGSYASRNAAQKGWRKRVRQAPNLLEGIRPSITEADMGLMSATRYRVRTPPYQSAGDAEKLCSELYELGIDCLVVEIPDNGRG